MFPKKQLQFEQLEGRDAPSWAFGFCMSMSAGGVGGTVCIDRTGISAQTSLGAGLTGDGSVARSWDGTRSYCAGGSAGGGIVLYGSYGNGYCVDQHGQSSLYQSVNFGPGVGARGIGNVALTFQMQQTTPFNGVYVGHH
jgi:hypothetical protein